MTYRLTLKQGVWIAAALLCCTCASAQARKAEATDPALRGVSLPVAISVKTDKKVYKPNEPIKMTLTVKNSLKDTVKLPFSSGQKYDIEIFAGKGRQGQKVWQWSHGKMFTQMLSTLPLAAGKTITFTAVYDPNVKSLEKPPQLPAGTYTIWAILTTMGRAPRPSGGTIITVK